MDRKKSLVYAPYYKNSMLGDNKVAGSMPFVGSDEGTPFSVIVIAVHGNAAIEPRMARASGPSASHQLRHPGE